MNVRVQREAYTLPKDLCSSAALSKPCNPARGMPLALSASQDDLFIGMGRAPCRDFRALIDNCGLASVIRLENKNFGVGAQPSGRRCNDQAIELGRKQ